MALTRKLLEGMGIEDKQIETIIEAHSETVTALKAERDKAKETAAKVPDLQRQLEEAKKATEEKAIQQILAGTSDRRWVDEALQRLGCEFKD